MRDSAQHQEMSQWRRRGLKPGDYIASESLRFLPIAVEQIGRSKQNDSVDVTEAARVKSDLHRYLQHRTELYSSGLVQVMAELRLFASEIVREGFEKASASLRIEALPSWDHPFLEICNTIVGCHLRHVAAADRDLTGKSLYEAYLYFADPERAFERPDKTRFTQTLRRTGPDSLPGLFLCLHVSNVISTEIREKVRNRIPEQKQFELYMLSVDSLCRHVVKTAMQTANGESSDRWAAFVCKVVEAELLPKPRCL